MNSGLVSHIQRYSLQDGPGIRTTVFLKGCPLACAWCHNPENLSRQAEVMISEARCARCGLCASVCQEQRESSRNGDSTLPWSAGDRCRVCGACVEACPAAAREVVGRRMTVEQVLTEILADRIFYDDSGGGATFSGGEPLLQFGFLLPLLRACRAEGIHTAVDTCGFAAREQVLQVAEAADLVLYDLKFVDEALHREFCGASNRCILENLRELSRISARVWIRIPVIPGVNDSPEELARLADFVAGLPRVHPVHLLPYHRTGVHKFDQLDRSYRLHHVVPPSEEYMDAVSARFTAAGLSPKTGG